MRENPETAGIEVTAEVSVELKGQEEESVEPDEIPNPEETLLFKMVVGVVKLTILMVAIPIILIAALLKILFDLAILFLVLSLLFSCPPALLILIAIAACSKE